MDNQTKTEILNLHRNIFFKSLLEGHAKGLEDLYHQQFTLAAGGKGLSEYINRSEAIDAITNASFSFSSITLEKESVLSYGNVAIINGILQTHEKTFGKNTFRTQAIYLKENDKWMLYSVRNIAF